ncbi:hypothetical protein ACX1C1_21650 [Paenibacillus sp. strain BS8-2]
MTNGTAIGYMIIAARRAGLDKDTIQRLEATMYLEMDRVTEGEAEQAYQNS